MNVIAALTGFLRVAETGSFSAAAGDLKLTQPAVSRQIQALEDHFGARLFHRTTGGLSLTAEGERTIPLARKLLDAMDELNDAVKPAGPAVKGRVRLSVPAPLGLYLSDRLGPFLARHPDLAIDLILKDSHSDLIGEAIDIEVRLGNAADSGLISRRIGWTTAWLVASPAYLAAHPAPVIPADLKDHDCICYSRGGDGSGWSFSDGAAIRSVQLSPRLVSNNAVAVHRAALAGAGLAVLSHILAGPDIAAGRLIALMPDYPPERLPIDSVYLSRRNMPMRVRAVLDFLVEAVGEDGAMSAGGAEGVVEA